MNQYMGNIYTKSSKKNKLTVGAGCLINVCGADNSDCFVNGCKSNNVACDWIHLCGDKLK